MLVIHENRGMLPHFPDVARRLAVEGYAALAVDMLSREGGTGTFASTDDARDALRKIERDQIVGDADAGVAYLQAHDFVRRERVGVMGFCFGGSITWLLAVRNPVVKAAAFLRQRPASGRDSQYEHPCSGNLRWGRPTHRRWGSRSGSRSEGQQQDLQIPNFRRG